MKKHCLAFILIFFFLLGVAAGHAQEVYLKTGIGIMSPMRRSLISAELGRNIAPGYSIGMAGEVSATESNVSPMLTYARSCVGVQAGMGWGHRWQREGCCDHNFHTYTVGVYWTKSIRRCCSIYVGCAGVWRSYQAHIGLHRGSLKMCAGVELDFQKKRKDLKR